ncbi:hypothetical protein HispidOSU_015143 [Sigmodon hispidus]
MEHLGSWLTFKPQKSEGATKEAGTPLQLQSLGRHPQPTLSHMLAFLSPKSTQAAIGTQNDDFCVSSGPQRGSHELLRRKDVIEVVMVYIVLTHLRMWGSILLKSMAYSNFGKRFLIYVYGDNSSDQNYLFLSGHNCLHV